MKRVVQLLVQITIKWKKVIIGFVDDKRQYANDWNNNSLLTASINLQKVALS